MNKLLQGRLLIEASHHFRLELAILEFAHPIRQGIEALLKELPLLFDQEGLASADVPHEEAPLASLVNLGQLNEFKSLTKVCDQLSLLRRLLESLIGPLQLLLHKAEVGVTPIVIAECG